MSDMFVAGRWDVPAAVYYADREADSHSTVERFIHSPQTYQAAVTLAPVDDEESDALAFGRMFHCYVLEPAAFAERYYREPEKVSRATKAGKEAAARWARDAAGRELVKTADYDRAVAMGDAVRNHPFFRAHADEAEAEVKLRWEHPSGLKMRSMLDLLVVRDGTAFGFDLKSCRDPRPKPWSRSAWEFGYHRQQACYEQALRRALGIESVEFYFFAVGKSAPHECGCYRFDAASMLLASQEFDAACFKLAERKALDYWQADWNEGAVAVSVPPFAFS